MIPPAPPTRRLAYAALAAAGTLWGASFPLGKVALAETGPAYLVLYRFVLASLVLLPFLPRTRLRIARRDLGLLVVGAVLMGPVMFLVQFEGLDRTTASSAALLVGIAPPLLAVGAAFFDGEWPGRWTWTAVAFSAVGVALLVGGPGEGRTLLGDGLVLISMVAAVAWTLLTRRVARRVGVLHATTVQFALGTVLLAIGAVVLEGPPPLALSAGTWAAVLALGLLCSALTFWLWNWGLQGAEAAQAGVFGNLEPLVGALLGVTLLGEHLGPLALVGGALVLAAAWLTTRDEAPSAETREGA